MAVLDTYYELVPRETEQINGIWKGFHILLSLTAIVFGFATAFTFGKGLEGFGDNCVLFANITFKPSKNGTDDNLTVATWNELNPIDHSYTEWGSINLCNFCQFAPVLSIIFGFIWLTFFFMCAKGGLGYATDKLHHPWDIVYPAMIFSGLFSFVLWGSSVQLSRGIEQFCAEFEPQFGTKACSTKINEYTLAFNDEKQNVIIYFQIAMYASYFALLSWVSQFGILIVRVLCVVDFKIYQISISSKTDEVEQVIVEPDSKISLSLSESTVPGDKKRKPKWIFKKHDKNKDNTDYLLKNIPHQNGPSKDENKVVNGVEGSDYDKPTNGNANLAKTEPI